MEPLSLYLERLRLRAFVDGREAKRPSSMGDEATAGPGNARMRMHAARCRANIEFGANDNR